MYPLAVHPHHITGSSSVGEGDNGGEGRDGSWGGLRAGLHSGVGGVLPGGAVHTLTERYTRASMASTRDHLESLEKKVQVTAMSLQLVLYYILYLLFLLLFSLI